ncbi:MAG: pilin [bacterium]
MIKKTLLLTFLIFAILTPTASINAAEDPCTCYCKSAQGAGSIGTRDSKTSCRSDCNEGEGTPYLGCYTSEQEDQKPVSNQLCWTQAECEADITKINGEEVESVWGGQESECIAGEGHCYNQPGNISLSVAIGEMTEVGSIGAYIEAVYLFLIPAAGLVAIIMLMIGGLQWMLARGNPAQLGKAKERMGKAVIGLILILSAYSIAALVDPNLVSFQALSPPKVRRIVFLDANSTCEALIVSDAEVTMNPGGTGVCGDTGKIESVPEGVILQLEAGDTCVYSTCEEEVEACMSVGADQYDCMRCGHSFGTSVNDALPPSENNCARTLHKQTVNELEEKKFYYCEYYDASLTSLTEQNACAEIVYPKDSASLECKRLEQDHGASCRSYDNAWGLTQLATFPYEHWGWINELDDFYGADDNHPLLTKICDSDPCDFAPPDGSCHVFSYGDWIMSSIVEPSLIPDFLIFKGPVNYLTQIGCFDNSFVAEMDTIGQLMKSAFESQFKNISAAIGFGSQARTLFLDLECINADGTSSALSCHSSW